MDGEWSHELLHKGEAKPLAREGAQGSPWMLALDDLERELDAVVRGNEVSIRLSSTIVGVA